MNRTRTRFPTPAVFAIALLLVSSFSFGEQPAFGRMPTPPVRPDPKTIAYVDQIMISVMPELEPAFGKPLRAELVERISELAGVRITYVRNGGGYHLFQLPKKGYEAEAEALCEKIKQDARIKWCEINSRFYLQSVSSPNDPVFTNGQQWNLTSFCHIRMLTLKPSFSWSAS